MTEILVFISYHPIVSVLLAWTIFGSITKIVLHTYRFIMVTLRGWPPAHLDAYGNWKPKKKEGGQ